MNSTAKRFIENNIKLIESEQFTELYNNIPDKPWKGDVSAALLTIGINPLKYLNYIPMYFLYTSESVTEIDIPENITSMDWCAFEGCVNLEYVHFSTNNIKLSHSCFKNCVKLKELILPEGIKQIPSSMCINCESLKHIVIPESVQMFSHDCFSGCGDNVVIDFGGTREAWNMLYDKDAFTGTYFVCNCSDGIVRKRKPTPKQHKTAPAVKMTPRKIIDDALRNLFGRDASRHVVFNNKTAKGRTFKYVGINLISAECLRLQQELVKQGLDVLKVECVPTSISGRGTTTALYVSIQE